LTAWVGESVRARVRVVVMVRRAGFMMIEDVI
jgi:hypothetical protein